MHSKQLIDKYNVQGPRYTSYPTVPFWDKEGIAYQDWTQSVANAFHESNQTEGISLYIHLPFCESMCTFCGCHKRITKRHSVENPYIETLLKEWGLYCELFDEKPIIKEIHLGGGTPTFFSPENLEKLILGILSSADLHLDADLSFEGHPNNTTYEHLETLFKLGFRRNSFGVQDYDPKVQKTINRIQPYERVESVTKWSREIGYTSVSHDLVFGLPHQTVKSITDTINQTSLLMPDRISLYSYAHVPWIKGVGQRGFDENDLPSSAEKRELYEVSKEMLGRLGYVEIGMDHFVLPHDSMYKAMMKKSLHRNFMGYTAGKTQLMVGLGVSSISDSWNAYAQNIKSLEEYTEMVHKGILPIFRGHLLNKEDLVIRQHILNIMCHFETSWKNEALVFPELAECLASLKDMESDFLIKTGNQHLKVYDEARAFVRNVCMAFDLRLKRKKLKERMFSMTI